MRVTAGFFVSALIRRAMRNGGFAAVLRRGAEEAGAIMIVTRSRSGAVRLYRPAAQADYAPGQRSERLFTPDSKAVEDAAIQSAIERETRFDPDVWVVEIETDNDPGDGLFAVTTP